MYKGNKKFISLLLAITFIVNIFIPTKVFAGGQIDFTASFDNASKIFEIASTSQNAQEFFDDVREIKINENFFNKDSNQFTVETGKLKIENFTPTLLKVNNITLASNSYGNKSFVFNYADGAAINDGVEITSVVIAQEGQSNIVNGQEMGAVYDALQIHLDQTYSDNYYELSQKIKGVRIDGRDYPMRNVENGRDLPVFVMFERAYRIYYNSPIGKIAIDDYRLRDKHEVVITFVDDSTVVRKDEGYVAPDRSNDGDVFNQPSQPANPTGIAAKYEIEKVEVEESYGDKELKIYPKAGDGKLARFAVADVNKIIKVKINGTDVGVPDTMRLHRLSGGILIDNNNSIIVEAEKKTPIGIELYFDDGSVLSKDATPSNSGGNVTPPRRQLVPTAKAYLLNAGKTELSKADSVFTRDIEIKALDERIGLWNGAEIIVEFKPMTVQGVVSKVTKVEYETMGGSKSTAQKVLGSDGKYSIRVPDFIIKEANSVEDTELVLHLTTSAGHSGTQKVVMLIDWNDNYTPPTAPTQPEQPSTNIASKYTITDVSVAEVYGNKQLIIKTNPRITSIDKQKLTNVSVKGNDGYVEYRGNDFIQNSEGSLVTRDEDIIARVEQLSKIDVKIKFNDNSVLTNEGQNNGGTNPPNNGGTNPPNNGGTNPPNNGGTENPPTEAKQIKVKAVRADDESQASMLNNAINPNAKLVEKNGKFEYTIQLKPISVGGSAGISVDKFSIYKGTQKEVVAKTTVTGDYPDQYTFELDQKADKLKVAIAVSAMGGNDIDSVLVFDYSDNNQGGGDNNGGTNPPNNGGTNPPNNGGTQPEQPGTLGAKYKIQDIALNEYEDLKIGTEPNMSFNDIAKITKLIINGKDVGKPATLRFSMVDDKLMVAKSGADVSVIEEAKKKTPISIIIHFEDGSKTEFNTNVPQTDNNPTVPGELTISSNLPNGEYTLTYKAYKKGTSQSELSALNGFFDKKIKLVVEDGVKKVTLLNHSYADLMLDFAIRKSDMRQLGGENQLYASVQKNIVEKDRNNVAKKVEYTVALQNLEGIKEFAVLGSGVMGGNASDIGNYTSPNYKMLEIVFDNAVTSGWTDFKVNEDANDNKERAVQILTAALIASGVEDTNNDGVLSPEELRNARGIDKTLADFPLTNVLDLENKNITDISLLKDLGPQIKAVNLNGNKITEIPSNVFDKATGITHLFLGANDISKIDKTAFQNLTELRYLDMEGNELDTLPEELLKNNTKLETLDINSIGLKTVPSDLIKNQSRLSELFMYQNELTSIPDDFFAGQGIRLKAVHINHNKLKALPSSLSNATDLQTLNAGNNDITAIPDSYKNLKNIRQLDLSNNELNSIPTEVLTNMIKHSRNAHMVGIDLSNNNIKTLPLNEMISALNSGGKKLSKFEINLNELDLAPTDEEIENYKKLGVLFDNSHDIYYPQKGFIAPEVVAENGNIKLTQKFDILELHYWDAGDSTYFGGRNVFTTAEDFERYLTREGRDFNFISRDLDRTQGIKAILDKKNTNWKVQTTITKDGQVVYSKLSDQNAAEGLVQTFADANMRTGDRYVLSKVLYVKNVYGMSKALSYSKTFVATSDATNTPSPQERTVKAYVLKADKTATSMANRALDHNAKIKAISGENSSEITLKFSEMSVGTVTGGVSELLIEQNGNLVPATKVANGEFKFKVSNDLIKEAGNAVDTEIKIAFKIYPEMPGHNQAQNAVLVLDWNNNFTEPNNGGQNPPNNGTNPTPPNNGGGGGGGGGTTSPTTHRVPVWLKNKNTNDKSMGNNALVQVAEVVENNGRFTYKVTLKPISIDLNGQTLNGEVTKFSVELDGVMRELSGSRTSSGVEYQFESNTKLHNVLVSIRVDVMAQLGMSDQEAILVIDWNGNNPAPNTNPQPNVPNAGGGGGATANQASTPAALENRAKQVLDERKYYSNTTLQKVETAQQELKNNVEGAKERLEQALAVARVEKIEKVFANGYVKPNAKNEFRPNVKLTRGELAELFADAINKIDTVEVKFGDVPANASYSKGVQVLAQNGLITGYVDGSFKPEGEITRAEFAVMIAKILNLAPAKKDIKDVQPNHWAYGYLAAMMEKGIIKGYENGEVRPNGNITRAEAIVMLNRAFAVKAQNEKNAKLADVANTHWAYEAILAAVK